MQKLHQIWPHIETYGPPILAIRLAMFFVGVVGLTLNFWLSRTSLHRNHESMCFGLEGNACR